MNELPSALVRNLLRAAVALEHQVDVGVNEKMLEVEKLDTTLHRGTFRAYADLGQWTPANVWMIEPLDFRLVEAFEVSTYVAIDAELSLFDRVRRLLRDLHDLFLVSRRHAREIFAYSFPVFFCKRRLFFGGIVHV